jgi:ribose transport system permease protein
VVAWTVAARAYSTRAALLVAAALLVYPAYGLMFHELSSEPIFCAGFALWALLVVRAAEPPSTRRFLWVGLGVALLAGLAWGMLNGFLIAKARIPPLIVTLGTLGMSLGAALLITGGVDERDVPFKLVDTIGSGRVASQVPYLVIIAFAVALVFGVLLAATRFGRHTYAVGSNEEAARRAGIAVDRHLVKVYALAGTLSGLAGFLSVARFATTNIGGEASLNLQAIAAVVLGGTSLFGGVGTIVGTVIGVFIPAVLQNGFVILGVQPFWQSVVVGAFLIAAVYVDQLRRRARPR